MLFILREENKLLKVAGESSFVGFKSLLSSIFSSVIDVDSDGFGELDSQSDCFDFCECESLSESGPVIISNGLASH